MTCAACLALAAALGVACIVGAGFIAALAIVLSQLDRRRYVRRLHRMRSRRAT